MQFKKNPGLEATPSVASTDSFGTSSRGGVATPSTMSSAGTIAPSIADTLQTRTISSTDAPSDPIPDIQISTLTSLGKPGDNKNTILISLTPPPTSARAPVELVCVIDVSGSMASEASIKDADGKTESNGLSILDVVKHSMRTIIASLEDQDRLGIVSFSNSAYVNMQITNMDKEGKQKAEGVVNGLKTLGSTNLWDGLKTGLEVMKKAGGQGRVKSVFILTDGCPNVEPPRGSVAMLRSYMDQNSEDGKSRGATMCTVNTFGFGYSLDSAMLHHLSIEGNGVYSFIPDAGMVGTAFINALGNIFVTMAMNATLSIEFQNDVEPVGMPKPKGSRLAAGEADEEGPSTYVLGGHKYTKTSWGLQVYLGTVQFSQSKDIIVYFTDMPPSNSEKETKDRPFMTVKLDYDLCTSPNSQTISHTLSDIVLPSTAKPATKDAEVLISQHINRLLAVDTILSLATAQLPLDIALAFLQAQAIDSITTSPSASTKAVKALLEDLTGQTTLAISKADFYSRWGQHYLRSLSRAHLLQQCNNFKDPGVQVYGGEKYRDLREKLDKIFDSLPAPKPSLGRSRGRPSIANMGRYNRPHAPCFTGEGLVQLAGSETKLVRDIKKGDILSNGSTVRCVMVTKIKGGKTWLSTLPGTAGSLLRITPYHPVLSGEKGGWTFPKDISEPEFVPCTEVYSFLLNREPTTGAGEHTVRINGVTAVTLGHGYINPSTEAVRGHEFLGSYSKVEKALRKVDGKGFEEEGRVEVGGTKRDAETALVCGFVKPGEAEGVEVNVSEEVLRVGTVRMVTVF